MKTDILIIGGGLSGLYLAHLLQKAGRSFELVEAKVILGGRALTVSGEDGADQNSDADLAYDLGPAWFWPAQPRMEALLQKLGVPYFEQYSRGTLVYEEFEGNIKRDIAFSTMAGAFRISGGVGRLIEALANTLPTVKLHTKSKVMKITEMAEREVHSDIECSNGDRLTVRSRHVVLALPPQVVAETIEFKPSFSPDMLRTLEGIPTWMAGHAKIIAVYETPFWRAEGLSGDGISGVGPLAEIHDASPQSLKRGALFGFVGTSFLDRHQPNYDLKKETVTQLARMYGPEAGHPTAVFVKDWADDPLVAVKANEINSGGHPIYGLPAVLKGVWGRKLVFGSTEVATEFGGFLEGALEAAEQVFIGISDMDELNKQRKIA